MKNKKRCMAAGLLLAVGLLLAGCENTKIVLTTVYVARGEKDRS